MRAVQVADRKRAAVGGRQIGELDALSIRRNARLELAGCRRVERRKHVGQSGCGRARCRLDDGAARCRGRIPVLTSPLPFDPGATAAVKNCLAVGSLFSALMTLFAVVEPAEIWKMSCFYSVCRRRRRFRALR